MSGISSHHCRHTCLAGPAPPFGPPPPRLSPLPCLDSPCLAGLTPTPLWLAPPHPARPVIFYVFKFKIALYLMFLNYKYQGSRVEEAAAGWRGWVDHSKAVVAAAATAGGLVFFLKKIIDVGCLCNWTARIKIWGKKNFLPGLTNTLST